jgi:hypothetical protein
VLTVSPFLDAIMSTSTSQLFSFDAFVLNSVIKSDIASVPSRGRDCVPALSPKNEALSEHFVPSEVRPVVDIVLKNDETTQLISRDEPTDESCTATATPSVQ